MTVIHVHDPRGPLPAILDNLDKVKRIGAGWTARCPAHEDRNPSLSISEGADGRVLLHCHAGCTVESICVALHIDEAELFPPRDGPRREVAVYKYEDETGRHLYDVVRFEPKDFRQRRADGTWGLGDTRRILYRLPQVRAAIERGDTIYVVEGEKDVLAIERAGGTATCNPMGAGKWRSEYVSQLAGAPHVVIVADNDDPGIAHAGHVSQHLEQARIPHKIAVAATGKDAADHLNAGHSLAELVPRISPTPDEPHSWDRVDLTDPQYGVPPDPPSIMGLLYASRRHVVSGPPESTKTLIAYLLLVHALRDGLKVAIVDFEMGPTAARRMLEDVGATIEEIAGIYYVEPDTPPEDGYAQMIDYGVNLVLIDAAAGAYDATGLDDNARKDAEQFARAWIRPLWQAGITTVLVDHVTKDAAARGKFTIGSERKVGQADVHISCDALKPLSRGNSGIVKITVHKDRPGFLPRPTAAVFELHSHPGTHAITYSIRETEHIPDDDWKPTIYMELVSKFVEKHPESSRSRIEDGVKGMSATHKRQAIDFLVEEGYAISTDGPRKAQLITIVRPYRQSDTTPSHPVPPRPDGVTTTPSDGVPPTGAPTGSTSPNEDDPVRDKDGVNVYDPAIQSLLDDDIPF